MSGASSSVGWGIMGCANIAVKNARAVALSHNSKIVAVASRSLDRARAWCQENLPAHAHAGYSIYGTYEDLLKDPAVQAVYLPAPTATHLELVTLIANAKKHVLCEKPCAVTAVELRKILDVCRKNGVQFMDGVMFMHNPRIQKLASKINDSGNFFGELQRVTSLFSFKANESFLDGGDVRTRADADPLGSLGDLGWYCIRIGLVGFRYTEPHSIVVRNFHKNSHGVIIDLDADVFWNAEKTKVLTFHCSFNHTFRQFTEFEFSKYKRIVIDDFVIPKNQSENLMHIEHFTPGSPFVDKDCVQLSTWETVRVSDTVQEAEMFNTFSSLVQAGKTDEFWFRVADLTQSILQGVLDSIEAGGKEILFKTVDERKH
eukprot:TRINITY_DN7566_c0_g1_i1.p2 TRINITY_DN7566_c0_g1~~TRINITY_DN7566_c0_g1_i1.p2  ORF type:complete len:373 (+),score=106.60 TRINITY_DN7566_c0_g1_i1:1302-2420(+)